MINDLVISQIRQRLEILYQMVDELEAGGGGGGGGTTNYNELSNKPAIEGTQLVGNKTASDLGLATTSQLNGKVDKVEGSSLMTSAQATKLEGIEAGAEVNVQADWNQANSSADDYIKNKPTLGTAAERGVDTVPTDDSTNLITSGAVYDAIQGGGSGGDPDLTPVNIGQQQSTFPSQYEYLLENNLPFTFRPGYPNFAFDGAIWRTLQKNGVSYTCFGTKLDGGTGQIQWARMQITRSNLSWGNLSTVFSFPNQNSFSVWVYGQNLLKQIDANDSLDSYGEGRWSGTAAVAATLTNCPTTDEFELECYTSKTGAFRQVLSTITANPIVYRRTRVGGTWGSWYKFEGTIVT